MHRLALHFLGPPYIELGPDRVDVHLAKANALLMYLSVTRQAHSRETLATLLWPFSGQSAARANLRAALHDARYHLPGPALLIEGDTLELNSLALLVDVWQLRDIALKQTSCKVSIDELALTYRQKLHRAIELYREDEDEEQAPERIVRVSEHMDEASGNFRWFKP